MNNAIDIQATPVPEPDTSQRSQAMIVRPTQEVQPGLFGTSEPVAVIEKASAVATALKQVIKKQGLISNISGKEYPKCEAWTLLGTMLGVFPVTVWTKQLENGWEARVEARTKDGSIIGAAEAQCLKSERNWGNRDDFALRSMAQTRATAKCLRMPLGFVMTLAGFEATPSEEMPHDEPPRRPARQPETSADRFSKAANTRPPATPPPVKNNAPPPPRKVQEAIFADAETRKRMIVELRDCAALAVEYFQKLPAPTVLLPGEGFEDVPLRFVPITRNQMKALQAKIADFGNGAEAAHAFPPNPEPPVKDKPAQPPSAKSGEVKGSSVVDAVKAKDPEWFWDVIISVPRKGMKKADYDRKPDTIGSLYHSMKSGDEDEGRRLWGLVHHFDPQPREHNGRTFQPSEADHTTRKALDAFAEYEEKHHGDTAGQGEAAEAEIQRTGEPPEPQGGWQGATEPAPKDPEPYPKSTQAEKSPYEDDVPF